MTFPGNTKPTKKCSHPGCDKNIPNHHWGVKAAQRAGWFFQRNGENWCPAHHPDWVAEWRAKKKR